MDSRSSFLRQLRLDGKPLPPMADPLWLSKVAAKDDGFYAIPDTHITELGLAYSIRPALRGAVVLVSLLAILAIMMSIYTYEMWNIGPELWFAVATIGIAFLANMARIQHPRFIRRLPEISTYPIVPGKLMLVLIPQVPKRPVESVQLVLREYWQVAVPFGWAWTSEVLYAADLPLDGDEHMLRTTIDLPKSVMPSYETHDYKLQWLLVVQRTPTMWSHTPERYLLWVPHQLVIAGPHATVRLPGGRP